MSDDGQGDLAILRSLSTAVVSDALDRLNLPGQAFGLARVSGTGTVVGPAFTVRYEPRGTERGNVGDYIDDVQPGSVVVLANAGRLEMTVWGGLLSQVASSRGIASTVIDGVCRDIVRAQDLAYSIFSRGTWMRTGKDRVQAEAIQVPVSVGGVRVRPGDLVVGDADGVVIVPAERAAEIAATAAEIESAEAAISDGVANGERLDELRRRVGYFGLQRVVEPERDSKGGIP